MEGLIRQIVWRVRLMDFDKEVVYYEKDSF